MYLLLQTGTLSMSMERQRYSISSRTQLNDHMSRLLGHLFSPVHDNHMRSAVVKEFWALNDAKLILNFALNSNFKKLVSSVHCSSLQLQDVSVLTWQTLGWFFN